jgi:tol-pal system protein YbgF
MASLRDDNRNLTQTVSELRADRRVQDRKLRDLQHQVDQLRAATAASAERAVPVLPVEVAGPAVAASPPPADAARVVGIADDGTEIVYEGDAASGRHAAEVELEASPPSGAPRHGPAPVVPGPLAQRSAAPPLGDVPAVSDRLEVTRHIPPISARAQLRSKTRDHDPPSDRGGDAANDYRAAVELVKAGKHADAIAALRGFIASYPRHDYADNAQYWLGEAYYAQKQFSRALSEFRAVIEVYPRGNKVPDALLKVGYCYAALGQAEKARAVLEQVVTLYPKSEPATLAAKRLETP